MTDLAELKRLAEAATQGSWFVAPNGSAYYGSEPAIFSTENGPRGPKICSAAWGFATKGGKADYYFIAAANPSAILSLIQRVEEAEAHGARLQSAVGGASNAAWAQGRLAGIEEAAECADFSSKSATDKFDQRVDRARKGEKNLELAAATAAGMDHAARNIAQAIRALKEKA